MKPISETIRKIVGYLNNPAHEGGIWLPNIQRNFMWSEGQIPDCSTRFCANTLSARY